VYAEAEPLVVGNANQGLRILRVQPAADMLRLVLEGRAGREYTLGLRTSRTLTATSGVRVRSDASGQQYLLIRFDAPSGSTDVSAYVRREISLSLGR